MAKFSIKSVDGLVAIEFEGDRGTLVFYAEKIATDPKELKSMPDPIQI